jgi:hypothetical protein
LGALIANKRSELNFGKKITTYHMNREWSEWTYFQKLWWWIATVFCGFGVRSRVGSALYEIGVPAWFPGTKWEIYLDKESPVMPTSVVNAIDIDGDVNEEAYGLRSGLLPSQGIPQEELLKLMILERQRLDLEMEIKWEKLQGGGPKLRKLEKKLKDILREIEDTMEEAGEETGEETEEETEEETKEEAKEESGASQVTQAISE